MRKKLNVWMRSYGSFSLESGESPEPIFKNKTSGVSYLYDRILGFRLETPTKTPEGNGIHRNQWLYGKWSTMSTKFASSINRSDDAQNRFAFFGCHVPFVHMKCTSPLLSDTKFSSDQCSSPGAASRRNVGSHCKKQHIRCGLTVQKK